MELRYRPDIDGLRAAAVAGVLLFHADVSHSGGGFFGVDVFFVISGYLITSLLVTELDGTGRIDFANFWARRTRRILPSALLVIAATLFAAFFVVSDLKYFDTTRDSIYAALYVINWQQLAASLDYFNEDGKSLFLHYWSLAVEEQFYVFLALVFAAAVGLGRFLPHTRAVTSTQVLIGLLAVAGLGSFVANIVLATSEPMVAFFGTHARIWELCLGAAVGLLERSGWSPSTAIRSAMAWLGAAAIAFAFVDYNLSSTVPPGLFVMVPVCGAFLFILAGINPGSRLPVPLWLGATLLPVAIGKLSYALYLWHWPVFELYKAYFGSWTVTDRAVALGATVVLSILSHITVENPIRFSKALAAMPLRSLGASAAVSLLLVAAAAALHQNVGHKYIVLASGKAFDPQSVRADRMGGAEGCNVGQQTMTYKKCGFGRRKTSRRIFLVGDSHAVQWFAAVEPMAKKYGMRLSMRTKSSCAAVEVPLFNHRLRRHYHECDAWRSNLMAEIEETKPEVVIIAHSSRHRPLTPDLTERLSGAARLSALAAAERAMIRRITATGAKVVMIADTPWLPEDPVDCLSKNSGRTQACRWPVRDLFRDSSPWSARHESPPAGVAVVDMTDVICPDGFCYAADSQHVIMRDRHHLTASYVGSVAQDFDRRLEQALGRSLKHPGAPDRNAHVGMAR